MTVALVVLALAALAWALSRTFAEARESLHRFDGWALVWTVPVAGGMLLASAVSFAVLVCAGRYPFKVGSLAVTVYVIAQPLKYLPGKVWGFAYQVRRLTEHIPWQQATVASVNHALLALLLSFFALGGVLGGWMGVLLAFIGAVGTMLWVGQGGVERSLPACWQTHAGPIHLPFATLLGLCVNVAVEWGTYFGVWAGLLLAFDAGITLADIVVLATLYSGAWLVSSLIAVIPGGIGVREGGFVLMGAGLGYNTGNLLAMATVVRLVFTLGELLLLVLVSIYLSVRLRSEP
ncbi:MAG: hypothetical protein WAV07_03865 [Candidatus Contendobacter sp.]